MGVTQPRGESFTERIHLQILAPKGNQLWLARSESDYKDLGRFFADFFQGVVLSRLDEISSVDGFISSVLSNGTDRYNFDVECFLYVSAAQALHGDLKGALSTMREHYDLDEPMHREYAPGFEYLRQNTVGD
jgi:hypothetical protein